MQPTLFFSWQSDIRAAANRTLIEEALRAAAAELGADPAIDVEPVVDRDTAGLGGSPNIRDAILAKIDAATVLIADVTPINAGSGSRLTPNPNVLIELGYAVKALGWPRIIMVLNTAFGRPEDLPFDLRGHRCLTYESAEDAAERASTRKGLQSAFRGVLADILKGFDRKPAAPPITLEVTFRKDAGGAQRHDYVLEIRLKNNGPATIRNWVLTAEVPARILTNMTHAHEVKRVKGRVHFRFPSDEPPRGFPLYPGETIERTIPYFVDDKMFDEGSFGESGVFSETVIVKAYANDELVGDFSKAFQELNNF